MLPVLKRSDFDSREQAMPLEMMYNKKGDRLYLTTANPGFVNLYDNSNPRWPKFLKTISTAGGRPSYGAVAR